MGAQGPLRPIAHDEKALAELARRASGKLKIV